MSSSIVPFVIRYTVDNGKWTPGAWRSKFNGRPTAKNLAAYVESMQASTLPGGCNAHLGATTILSATVTRQSDGAVVASFAR